jgi:hypothetical protein
MPDPTMKWQELERVVRAVVQAKFGATARAEDIAGVKCDCVAHLPDGSVVIVEISKEAGLDKLRVDLAKFAVLRPHFLQQNILPRCYFVCASDPTPALIESGRSNFVGVHSVSQFFNELLGLHNYLAARNRIPFGSAVDLYSGEPDRNKYVPVNYITDSGDSYSTDEIATALAEGRTIVLIGDYGSGKSRCVKEVFELLIGARPKRWLNPIAINLRDNWGLKRATEIITRHFTDLGLGDRVGDALKTAYSSATVYLLDGFDEIGAQTWSDDPTRLVEIRAQSLVGVKDLITRAKAGILIVGREHYFNNDAELITCLGLSDKHPLFLRCDQELSDQQFSALLGRSTHPLPPWMPRKPLIATIIRDIDSVVFDHILDTSTGQVDLWNLLIDTFCEREAKINPILDAPIIRSLYTKIGRLARFTSSNLGPISIKQINEAFEQTIGRPPTDESAIILQRLPGLSRIGAESLDRQFVDIFILDGLKAEDVLAAYGQADRVELDTEWKNPVGPFGAQYIAARLLSVNQIKGAVAFLHRNRDARNRVLLSDLFGALFFVEDVSIDMGGLEFTGGKFSQISLADSAVRNVTMLDCLFEDLNITDADPTLLKIESSCIVHLAGVTAKEHLPHWVVDCLVEDFQSMSTLSAIREAGLTVAQTFLLSSLRKLFLQPGAGRRESSMYKGYGDVGTKKICEKVIALLVRDGFCQKIRGTTEAVYLPNRSLTGRVRAIMSQLTMSKDDLWEKASKLHDR